MDIYKYLFEQLNFEFKREIKTWGTDIFPIKYELLFDNCHIQTFHSWKSLKGIYQLLLKNESIPISYWHKSVQNIIRTLKSFPSELESKDHVDLLLTLHGINKKS